MGEELKIRVEVDHFFEWLQEFEQRVQGLGGGGCWYSSAALKTRVQYSWYQAAAAGRPAICFSELHFSEPSNGQAIVQAVATCFLYGHHDLEAETLVVERPGTTSMCEWLAAGDFSPILAPGEAAQSWYLSREALLAVAEDNSQELRGPCVRSTGATQPHVGLAAKRTTEGDDWCQSLERTEALVKRSLPHSGARRAY